jgi:serine protease
MNYYTSSFYLLLFLSILSIPATSQQFRIPKHISQDDYYQGKLVVKVKAEFGAVCRTGGVEIASVNDALQRMNAFSITKKFPLHKSPETTYNSRGEKQVDISTIYDVSFDPVIPVEKAVNLLLATGKVEYAEPVYKMQLLYNPNDPDTASQYYLALIRAYDAWDISQGDSNLVVGVTDTGTDLDHPDLAAGIKYNYNDPINGIDDDNDGYIDNFMGWDVGQNDNDPSIDIVHGSFVSGLAGAVTDNGVGMAGPGFKVRYLPVKISNNGQLTAAYEGIVYAADHGCHVINCSWGSFASSQLGQDIIDYATFNQNSLVVGASGNSNNEAPFYPASYKNVLSVTGTNSTDTKWVNSSYGAFVDISAPGEAVYSTIFDNTYSFSSGTSFAAPIVAAAAALIKTQYPFYTPGQIAEQLRATADDIYGIPANVPFDKKLGKGRLNMHRALTENPKSVRMEDLSITDNNDNAFVGNDTLDIVVDLKNYLQPLNNLTVTLTSNNPGITILNGTINPGFMFMMGTYSNTSNPFKVIIGPSLPINAKVTFTLNFSDAGYSDWQIFDLVVNVDYINVLVNDVGTTITSRSRIGYNIVQAQGIGFTYNDGPSVWYEGGLMIGTDTARVSDQIFGSPTSVVSTDYVSMLNVHKVDPPVYSEFDLDSRFNDSGAGSATLEIEVDQNTYAWSNVPDSKYVIVEYIISNQGANNLNNLFAGIYADWDIGAVVDNRADYDAPRKMGYAFNTGNPVLYTAIKQLTPGGNNCYSLENDGSSGSIGIYNGFTQEEKYLTLSTQRLQAGQSGNGNDVSHTVASGPHTIPSGDSIKVAFALIAGEDLASIQASADAAQVKYNSLNIPIPGPSLVPGLWLNTPNPFSESTFINYTATGNARVVIEIFNVIGEKIITVVDGELVPGNYATEFRSDGLSNGVYYCRMQQGELSQVVKMIKLD